MNIGELIITSVLLGIGLAMDAFSVSIVNGMKKPDMKISEMCITAGAFGVFQFGMPMTGWGCIHTIATAFNAFQVCIPYIGFILLLYIGAKMILEGIKGITLADKEEEGEEPTPEDKGAPFFKILFIQAIATSIDALSVGFTTAEYTLPMALLSSMIIGIVTFALCIPALKLGRIAGAKLGDKANIAGGIILIAIGIKLLF